MMDFSALSAPTGHTVDAADAASRRLAQMVMRRAEIRLAEGGDDRPMGRDAPDRRPAPDDVPLPSWRTEVSALLYMLRNGADVPASRIRGQAAVADLLLQPRVQDAEFDEPVCGLFVCDRLLAQEIRGVRCDGERIVLHSSTGDELAVDVRPPAALALSSNDWYAWCAPETDHHAPSAYDELRLRQAETALAATGAYGRWVQAVVRHVTPLDGLADGQGTRSGSDPLRFGGIGVTLASDPAEVFDLLVHEASHQYVHLVGWFGPLVHPNLGEFPSPLRGIPRPLDKILLAYHACGNILLSLEAAVEAGVVDPTAHRAKKTRYTGALREMDRWLAPEGRLTALGDQLHAPLRRRLVEAGVHDARSGAGVSLEDA